MLYKLLLSDGSFLTINENPKEIKNENGWITVTDTDNWEHCVNMFHVIYWHII